MNTNRDQARPLEVGEAEFELVVLKSKQPVVVAFGAQWSRPCHILEASLEEVAATCGGRVKVVKINADDSPDLSIWYEIQSIPTLLYFVDGTLCARIVGTASKEAILAKLRSTLNPGNPLFSSAEVKNDL